MFKQTGFFWSGWHCTTWSCSPRLLPSQLYTYSLGRFRGSHCVAFFIDVFKGSIVSHYYHFPIANWRKKKFLPFMTILVVDISTCQTGISFIHSHNTQRVRRTLCALKISQRQFDLQNSLTHMLGACIRSVEGEAFRKRPSKDLAYAHPDTWNKRNSSRAESCTHNYEYMHIKQSQIPHLDTMSWSCLLP